VYENVTAASELPRFVNAISERKDDPPTPWLDRTIGTMSVEETLPA
jgi:hypothetical protein